MRVFLTGASGYLGGVLTTHLARLPDVEGITGVALTAPKGPLPEKMRFLGMDIRSPDLSRVMVGHDIVIHTACIVLWPSTMDARERDAINLEGTQNVAETARANRVAQFVHVSSMAAYNPALAQGQTDVAEDFPLGDGRTDFYYWNAKAEGERLVTRTFTHSGTVLTRVRPIYIIGPRNWPLIRQYQKNAVNFPRCNPRRQFIHEDDVAAAIVHALRERLEGAFNVVPDDTVRISDVWRMVGARFVPTVPLWLAWLVTWVRWRYFRSPIHPSWVADMLVDFTGSNKKLKKSGWQPRFSSVQALLTAIDAAQNSPGPRS